MNISNRLNENRKTLSDRKLNIKRSSFTLHTFENFNPLFQKLEKIRKVFFSEEINDFLNDYLGGVNILGKEVLLF